jgi:hypothetical protein
VGAQEQAVLVRQFVDGKTTLRQAISEWIRRWFAAAESFRDNDADRFVAQILPVAAGAQQSLASLAWTFQAKMLADITGDTTAPPLVSLAKVTGQALRGVDPAIVYRRPFTEIYRLLSAGKSMTQAITAGQLRAQQIAVTDLQLTSMRTANEVLTSTPHAPQYFRRVLTGHENCGLCILASTQRYHRRTLAAIHPGCDCEVAPLPDTVDPGQVLDPDLLIAAHDAIADRFGVYDAGGRAPDYRKVILVREHGELGPVLTVADHRFTGPDDIPAAG